MSPADGMTLRDYLDALRRMAPLGLSMSVVQRLAAGLAFGPGELDPHIRFNGETYTRNPVLRTPDFEVLLLCWRPGQVTPIHDHHHSFGVIRVVEGPLRTDPFDLVAPDGSPRRVRGLPSLRLEPGGTSTTCRTDIHRMGNFEGGRGEDLITLHTYVPPISRMTCFDPEKGLEWVRRILGPDGGTVVDDPPHPPGG